MFIKIKNVYIFLQGTHPQGGAHAKFTNYSFDVEEFVRIVSRAEKHVKNHNAFKEFLENRSNKTMIEETLEEKEIEMDEHDTQLIKDEL